MDVEMFVVDHGEPVPLRLATHVPGFVGAQDAIYILPAGLQAGQPVYVHATANSPGPTGMRFSISTLPQTLTLAADHARMIALSFGALMAMSVAALLIWFVLSDGCCFSMRRCSRCRHCTSRTCRGRASSGRSCRWRCR